MSLRKLLRLDRMSGRVNKALRSENPQLPLGMVQKFFEENPGASGLGIEPDASPAEAVQAFQKMVQRECDRFVSEARVFHW